MSDLILVPGNTASNCIVLEVYPDRSKLRLDKVVSLNIETGEVVQYGYPKLGEHKIPTTTKTYAKIEIVKRSKLEGNRPMEIHCHREKVDQYV